MAYDNKNKNYTLSEVASRINRIANYNYFGNTQLNEAEGDEEEPQAQQGPTEQGVEGMGQGMEQGGMEQQQEQQPEMGGEDMNAGMDAPMGEEPKIAMNEPEVGEFATIDGEDGEEEDVIDVDDLTQSQEATEFKVDNIDDKLSKVLNVISKFTNAIEVNDKKIDDLKAEIERRNPTPKEVLSLRSLASGPFSEQPQSYWDKLLKSNPNYDIVVGHENDDENAKKRFAIRRGDIDGYNEREIMNSLSESNLSLLDYLKF